MQHRLTNGAVDWDGFGAQLAEETNAMLGGARSVLLIDERGFAKTGEQSAGVARQWNGRLGKVDNCGVGVFAALCRGTMESLVDARLSLPRAWTEDRLRCERAAIPENARRYRSKTTLALAMVATVQHRGLQFGYVSVDGGDGKESAFLSGLDALGRRFVAGVHCNQAIDLQDPAPQVPAWSGRGRRPAHPQAQVPALRVDHWAAAQPPKAWRRLCLRGGEQGP
jgi:SRSO17 transposase